MIEMGVPTGALREGDGRTALWADPEVYEPEGRLRLGPTRRSALQFIEARQRLSKNPLEG